MRSDKPRDQHAFAGPESGPEPPYPIKLSGPVIKGFGRGSKELGIPTANIPPEGLKSYPDLPSGVYFGFVALSHSHSISTTTSSQPTKSATSSTSTPEIYPAVLSIGYNPFYKNTVRSVEIHILHHFTTDFYGAALNLLMLGYIRPELDYVSLEALVKDINIDCEVARRSLEREAYRKLVDQEGGWKTWLGDFAWMDNVDAEEVEKEVLKKE